MSEWETISPAPTSAKSDSGWETISATPDVPSNISTGPSAALQQLDKINQVQPPQQEPADPRNVLGKTRDVIAGGVEAAVSTATGMVGGGLGGWVGLMGAAVGAGDAETIAAKTAHALTYDPRTREGQQFNELIGKVINEIAIPLGPTHFPGAIPRARGVAQRYGLGGTAEKLMPEKATPPPTDPNKPPTEAVEPPTVDPNKEAMFSGFKKEQQDKSPLVQTAIRDSKTGEVTDTGPKHPEDLKAAGGIPLFKTEDGRYLTREEALEQAKRTEQVPKDVKPEIPEEGLHSGDLRKAGDERFKIPGEEAKAPVAEDPKYVQPQTHQEFREAIATTRNELTKLREEYEKNWANERDQAKADRLSEQIKMEEDALQKLEWDRAKADLPPPEIKDKGLPTWEELHDTLRGAKTVGEALTRVHDLGLGTKGQRSLLKLLQRSKLVNEATLDLHDGPLTGKVKDDSAGLYWEDKHHIDLGLSGDVRVLLHESIHAATHKLLKDGTSASAKAMQALFDKYKASHDKGAYGFQDVHEFVTEAFTQKSFQKILQGIDSPNSVKGKVLKMWDDFKAIIKEGLGAKDKVERTALDEVLDEGSRLIESSKDDTTKPSKTSEPKSSPKEADKPIDPRSVDPKDFEKTVKDIYEKQGEDAASKFYDEYQKYKATFIEPIKEIEKFVGININSEMATERVIKNTKDQMMRDVPDVKEREAISIAIEPGGVIKSLSEAAQKVAEKYKSLMSEIGSRALDTGTVKHLLEDYVTHIINWEGAPPTAKQEFINQLLGTGAHDPSMRGMTTESKFGKHRSFKTIGELEKYLDQVNERIAAKGESEWRLKLKTKDIAEIYSEYAKSMERAIRNKKLMDNIQQIRNVAGESLIRDITPENPLPHGWEAGQGQLAGKAIHPDMMPALKFVFDAGPDSIMQALGTVSQFTKRMNVIGSFFHAKSLMEVLSSAHIPIWTPIKEVGLGAVDKLAGTKFSGLSKAVDQFRKGGVGDNVDTWMKQGLQLEIPDDVSKSIITSTGKFADEMIGKYGPKTRVLEKSLSAVERNTLGHFDKFTWDYLHTGGKLMTADAYLTKARIEAAKSGKPFDEMKSRQEIARFVNESFGGLNWFDQARQAQTEMGKKIAMAAMNPAGRRGLQIALFAPDWTISTLSAFRSALPKSLNPAKMHPIEGVKGMVNPTTKGDYARLYQFKTAVTYFTLLNAINMMTANRPIWDNKDPSRIEWPDGTSMQAMKHAMEPYHWLADPDKTLSNKLGFIPKAAVVGIAGTEYASPQAQKLADPSGPGRAKAIAQMALPFQVQAAKGAPEGEGVKRAVLGTMGFPVYGQTKEQARIKRGEREKELKRKAREYHEKAKRKGWE
ncbi:hypothetical protein UFOVP1590_6 [uncultured Caudovirales phage]|uniref:Large polyvalent protein associated domain-containing protein n=1 Tax=uncultured Caudovirales phage TaxID=2100421 RepID=A0A6J5SNR6_9CAUD|nr:hypothetical protein UFOVP1590_6 [uncultured Caudovirales phage]